MRGILRRIALQVIVNVAKEHDNNYLPKLKPETINFYASGDDNGSTVKSIKSLTYKESEMLRDLMPNISVFGSGLSFIEGKSAISELSPAKEDIFFLNGRDEYELKILIRTINSTRIDETKKNGGLSVLMDEEDVKEWIKNSEKNANTNKELKSLMDKEVKGTLSDDEIEKLEELKQGEKTNSTQMLSKKEYVIPGITFKGAIAAKRGMSFTDIEKGMLYACLTELSLRQIGSCKKEGFGVGNWKITGDEINIESKVDENCFLGEKKLKINDGATKYINIFRDFVIENKVWEYLEIEDLFERIKL
jgi:hypothetical protein